MSLDLNDEEYREAREFLIASFELKTSSMRDHVLRFQDLVRAVAWYGAKKFEQGRELSKCSYRWPPPDSIDGMPLADYKATIGGLVDPNRDNPDAEWLNFIRDVHKLEEP